MLKGVREVSSITGDVPAKGWFGFDDNDEAKLNQIPQYCTNNEKTSGEIVAHQLIHAGESQWGRGVTQNESKFAPQ